MALKLPMGSPSIPTIPSEFEGQAGSRRVDWRQFSHFYEGTSGRSFCHDYKFGAGRDIIKNYFKVKTLIVDGEEFEESVGLED